MSNEAILEKLNNLPPEAQREALDFIEFLQTRYAMKPLRFTRKLKLMTDGAYIEVGNISK